MICLAQGAYLIRAKMRVEECFRSVGDFSLEEASQCRTFIQKRTNFKAGATLKEHHPPTSLARIKNEVRLEPQSNG